MTRPLAVLSLCLLAGLAHAAPPSGSPPGLEKVCEAKLPPPPFEEVASDAFKASLYTVPCDLTAERGVCLFDRASLTVGEGAALALVPVEPGKSSVVLVGSIANLVDDWQGETAYVTVDGQVVAKGLVPGKPLPFVTELLPPATADGPWTLVTTVGGVKVSRKVDPKAAAAVNYNGALAACGWSRDESGSSSTVFHLVAGPGDGATTTTVVATVRVVFQGSGQ